MFSPASGPVNGLGGVTLIAPGSQMTVDDSVFKIGQE